METTREALEAKLAKIDEEIIEAMQRLPAHSVKPPEMIDLFRLEDERDLLLEQLSKLR